MSTAITELLPDRAPASAGLTSVRAERDRELLVAAAAGGIAGGAVAAALTTRRTGTVRNISMGPGGWISFRGFRQPARIRTTSGNRPWWAHLLAAHRVRSHRKLRRTHG